MAAEDVYDMTPEPNMRPLESDYQQTIDALKAEVTRLIDKQENWIDRADDILSDLRAKTERLREGILLSVNHINYLEENGVEITGDWAAIRKWLTEALESESE